MKSSADDDLDIYAGLLDEGNIDDRLKKQQMQDVSAS